MPLPGARDVVLAEVAVDARRTRTERYLLPLGIAWEDDGRRRRCRSNSRWRACAAGRRVGVLTDAFAVGRVSRSACSRRCCAAARCPLPDGGDIRFVPTARLAEIDVAPDAGNPPRCRPNSPTAR